MKILFLAVVALCVGLPLFLIVRNPAAFFQKPGTVAIRKPGSRYLGVPMPAHDEAARVVDFAWLSLAAYQRRPNADAKDLQGCSEASVMLKQAGWWQWPDFPDAELKPKFNNSHLRMEVWEHKERNSVAVAFGGTVFTNRDDWRANFRWFIHTPKDDEYTTVVKLAEKAFIKEYKRRLGEGETFLNAAIIYSTGHSLGGGLAQEFAYALPIDQSIPRIKQVFAFDTSPVTGYWSVDKTTRENNEKGMRIDRIYERDEVLAIARALTSLVHPPQFQNPSIQHVRFNFFPLRNVISEHSMPRLACGINEAAVSTPAQDLH
jgi:hypothetical protein